MVLFHYFVVLCSLSRHWFMHILGELVIQRLPPLEIFTLFLTLVLIYCYRKIDYSMQRKRGSSINLWMLDFFTFCIISLGIECFWAKIPPFPHNQRYTNYYARNKPFLLRWNCIQSFMQSIVNEYALFIYYKYYNSKY